MSKPQFLRAVQVEGELANHKQNSRTRELPLGHKKNLRSLTTEVFNLRCVALQDGFSETKLLYLLVLLALVTKNAAHVGLHRGSCFNQILRSDVINGVAFNTRFVQPDFSIRYRLVQVEQFGERLPQARHSKILFVGQVLWL
jgi:hypothetical protein